MVKRKKRRARRGLLRRQRVIWEASDGLKPVGERERIWFHRDLDRWCLRIETTADTRVWDVPGGIGGGGGEERDEKVRLMIENAIEATSSELPGMNVCSFR
ncbi:hypothetical protein U1Q18_034920 [Sarracenia purpurea var. burkii]